MLSARVATSVCKRWCALQGSQHRLATHRPHSLRVQSKTRSRCYMASKDAQSLLATRRRHLQQGWIDALAFMAENPCHFAAEIGLVYRFIGMRTGSQHRDFRIRYD